MRSSKLVLPIMLSVLISIPCFAQSKNQDPGTILTRISYRTTYAVDWRQQQGYPQICFALYHDGYYRLSRMTESGMQGFQGTLSKDRVSRLGEMLRKLDAQRRENGIVRQGSEVLVVEMAGKAQRYTWVDADHQSPFPEPVVELVHWLQGFKAQDAPSLTLRDLSDQPICPPASEKPVQPTVAGLSGTSDATIECGERPR
jgi:hypothetical protein